MTAAPKGWIKQIETSILESKDIPMWGTFPGFPWEDFMQAFSNHFNLKPFKMRMAAAEWRPSSAVLSGMGHSPFQLSIELTPLQGSFSLIIPSEDFTKLSSWAISPKTVQEGFSDPFLQKGFFRYMTLEALNLVDNMQVFQSLTPKLVDMPLSKEEAYSIDIALEKGKETAWVRLVCPPLFRNSFKDHYKGNWKLSIPSNMYGEIDIDMSLIAGQTSITQEELANLNQKDFLLLDHCSYSPELKRGTFQIVFEKTPLFQVKLKDENIKILDYALYYEANKMSDENLEELDETFSSLPEEESVAEHSMPTQEPNSQTMISPKKVPINLSIEVAKMKINLDKLLKLKPGNTLELNVMPEQGVNLIANGKCIAKGDLIQIGEMIGVKITKIGHS